jgi:Na+/H+ antiporter NhaA
VAVGLFGVLVALRWVGVWRGPAAVLVGVRIWLAVFESGVGPVVTGLMIGLLIGASPPAREDLERGSELARPFREQPTPELAYTARAGPDVGALAQRAAPVLPAAVVELGDRPLFALANAGIRLDQELLSAAVRSPITLGLLGSLAIAKPSGVLIAAWLATRPLVAAPG